MDSGNRNAALMEEKSDQKGHSSHPQVIPVSQILTSRKERKHATDPNAWATEKAKEQYLAPCTPIYPGW